MSVRSSIRAGQARFEYEHETKPRLQRESAERRAKYAAAAAEREASFKASIANIHDGNVGARAQAMIDKVLGRTDGE